MQDSEKKLYPLHFLPRTGETPWGSVTYTLADLGYIDPEVAGGWLAGNTFSELMETYLERVSGDEAFEAFGTQFPVLVKVLDVRERQPLCLTAGDEVAAQRYDAFGKTFLWHVLEASEDAELFIGFNRDMDASAFYTRCRSGQVEPVLNRLRPRKGDTFLVRPGTVFAAGAGLKLLEISESSELMFHLHGWGKTEEDDLEEAFDLIDFRKSEPAPVAETPVDKGGAAFGLASCEAFTAVRLPLAQPLHISAQAPGSFAVYHCLQGSAAVRLSERPDAERFPIPSGTTLLVPAEVFDFFLVPEAPGTQVLEILGGTPVTKDSYLENG